MGRSFGGERLSIDYARLPGSTLEQRRKAIECENILVDILKFDGFFGANFDILKPKWIPTLCLCPHHCFRQFGYSRDKRSDCVQVVIALIVTPDGFPLAYEVMGGNTSDKTTLKEF